jgi:hypothetical protein
MQYSKSIKIVKYVSTILTDLFKLRKHILQF